MRRCSFRSPAIEMKRRDGQSRKMDRDFQGVNVLGKHWRAVQAPVQAEPMATALNCQPKEKRDGMYIGSL